MSHIVDNSKHFTNEGVEKGKLMCKHCKKSYAMKTLNVCVMAGHLSDLECAKACKIMLCPFVPVEVAIENVKYIKLIKSKRENKHNMIDLVQAEEEAGLMKIAEEMKDKSISKVIFP